MDKLPLSSDRDSARWCQFRVWKSCSEWGHVAAETPEEWLRVNGKKLMRPIHDCHYIVQ